MPNSDDAFAQWLDHLARMGHDREWLRRNAAALALRHARDPRALPLLPELPPPVRDRYRELD